MENTKTTRLLFKCNWILIYFWHSHWHYFGYILGKVAKPHLLESPQKSQNTSTFISIGLPIAKWQSFKNMKNLCFFGGSSFKWKNCWHLEFLMNQIYSEGCCQKKCLLKVWSFMVHPPQNGGPAKFLRNWTEIIF